MHKVREITMKHRLGVGFVLVLVLFLLLLSLAWMIDGPPANATNDSSGSATPYLDIPSSNGPGTGREPLCKPFSEYTVGKADLNKSISPCDLHFDADFFFESGNEKYLRLTIRRGEDQLQPYSYTWKVLNTRGEEARSWLATFVENRDGTYHTIVKLPPDEWNRSILDVYFEDVDGDGVREDVTYRVLVGEILAAKSKKAKPGTGKP